MYSPTRCSPWSSVWCNSSTTDCFGAQLCVRRRTAMPAVIAREDGHLLSCIVFIRRRFGIKTYFLERAERNCCLTAWEYLPTQWRARDGHEAPLKFIAAHHPSNNIMILCSVPVCVRAFPRDSCLKIPLKVCWIFEVPVWPPSARLLRRSGAWLCVLTLARVAP